MESVAATEIIETAGSARPLENRPEFLKASVRDPAITLRSRVRGRGRWYIDALEDNPRLAATVELILQGEEGIERAEANPLTGRVLVHFRPGLDFEWIEQLIHRALEFGPMSREEFSTLRSRPLESFSLKHVLTAEIGCTALKMALFGGCCPAALAAAGLLFLLHRRG
jgi:hypothetical protein